MSDRVDERVNAPSTKLVSMRGSGPRSQSLFATVGLAAVIGASSCCLLPLGLFLVGISGAWIRNLTILAPYQPLFLVITLACLAGGFIAVYRKPKAADCAEGSYCASPASNRVVKLALWGTAVLVVAAIAIPYAASVLL